MRFQWKLLALFLVIALTPIALGRTFGIHGAKIARDRLVAFTTETSIDRVKRQLLLLNDSYAYLLRIGRSRMELALDFQVSEMERLMLQEPVLPPQVFTSVDFKNPETAPLDMMDSANHFRIEPDGGMTFLDVSFGYPAISGPPGADMAVAEPNIARLAAMVPVYRRVDEGNDHMAMWHYTAFANGLHSVYPGHAGLPSDDDPRGKIWYRSAVDIDVDAAPWTHLFTDPVTRQPSIALSQRFHDANGEMAGVTAMVMPVSRLLGHAQLNQHAPPATSAFLTYLHAEPPDEAVRLLIISGNRIGRGGRSPQQVTSRGYLESTDIASFSQMMADMEMGGNGVRRMPYNGKDCFWVYGSSGFNTFLVLITPYDRILEPARTVESFIADLVDNMVTVTGYGVAVIIVVIVAAALLFSRSVTRPIDKLAEGALKLSDGDFDARVDIHSRDEFGQMGRVFNMMGPRLRKLSKMQHSLVLAMEVQQRLLPHGDPEVEGLDIAGVSLYCDETGGDYYDYLAPRDGNAHTLRAVVGDVADHGIPSALLMASARAFIRQRAAIQGDMSDIMADVNRQLVFDVEDSGQFMTLIFCEVDSANRKLRWVNAGHEPAIIYHPARDDFTELADDNPPLGVLSKHRFDHHDYGLSEGDLILLLTDGVLETFNRRGEMFGKDAIKDLLRQHAHRSAREVLSVITGAAEAFRQSDDPEDDVTLVVIKATGVS